MHQISGRYHCQNYFTFKVNIHLFLFCLRSLAPIIVKSTMFHFFFLFSFNFFNLSFLSIIEKHFAHFFKVLIVWNKIPPTFYSTYCLIHRTVIKLQAQNKTHFMSIFLAIILHLIFHIHIGLTNFLPAETDVLFSIYVNSKQRKSEKLSLPNCKENTWKCFPPSFYRSDVPKIKKYFRTN